MTATASAISTTRTAPSAGSTRGGGADVSTATSHCGVCGSPDVSRDEVDALMGGGALELAECQHCEHRWTVPLPPAPAVRPLPAPEGSPVLNPVGPRARGRVREVASAA